MTCILNPVTYCPCFTSLVALIMIDIFSRRLSDETISKDQELQVLMKERNRLREEERKARAETKNDERTVSCRVQLWTHTFRCLNCDCVCLSKILTLTKGVEESLAVLKRNVRRSLNGYHKIGLNVCV